MSRSVRHLQFVLLALAAAPALAQEGAPTYDLRQEYKLVAGDKISVQEHMETRAKYTLRAGDQVIHDADQVEGYDQSYVEEVQEVTADGDVVRSVRTYTHVRDLNTAEELDLKANPFKVQMSRDEDGLFRFTPLEEGAQLPELLERILGVEVGRKEADSDEEDARRLLVPEEPVAVGATWQLPVEKVCEVFKLPPESIAEGAEGSGALEAAEPVGERTMLKVALRFKLPMSTFNEMPCPEPMRFDATISLRVPAGATGPEGGVALEAAIKGKAKLPPDQGLPPGAMLDLDMTIKNSKSVERAP